MSKLTIRTNNVPRHLVYGYELTPKESADFDYMEPEDLATHKFFKFKGNVYDPSDFVRIEQEGNESGNAFAHRDLSGDFKAWHGSHSDTYFSGVVIRYTDDFESVVVGQYFC